MGAWDQVHTFRTGVETAVQLLHLFFQGNAFLPLPLFPQQPGDRDQTLVTQRDGWNLGPWLTQGARERGSYLGTVDGRANSPRLDFGNSGDRPGQQIGPERGPE